MLNNHFISAIIVAAGNGKRMGADINKVYLELVDRPVLAYSLEAFEVCELIDEIIVVTNEENIKNAKEIVDILNLKKVKKIISGGRERQFSVAKGLEELSENSEIVAIHDGARPLVHPEKIADVILASQRHGAAMLGVRCTDTVKTVDANSFITGTQDRNLIWFAHTPQAFKTELIKPLYDKLFTEERIVTDDSTLFEEMGLSVKMVEDNYDNIKITTPDDMQKAWQIIISKGENI